jgi:ribosomal protein L40E
VYADQEFFLGNYKVMISKKTATGETAQYGPYDISMRGNVDLTVRMDGYNNPLERLRVQIDNLSRYSNLSENDEVYCRGHVWKLFRGGHSEAAANMPVTLSLSNSGALFNGTTDGNGFFNITFRAPPPSERNITVTVAASEAGADPGSDTVLNLSVPMPRPDALRLNFQGFIPADRKYTRNKDTVTVYGNIEFMRKGRSIGVASNASVRINVNPGNRDFYATTDASGTFRVSLGRYSTVATYFITVSAVYTQGNLSVSAPPVSAQFTVKKEASAAAAAPIPMWLIVVVVVLVVGVVGVAAFFVMRMQAEAAKLVECGECGAFIPESALKCPKCGTEFETEVVKCSECGSWIPPNVTECPKCNAHFKKRTAPPKGQPPKPGAPGKPGEPAKPSAPGGATQAPAAPK